MNSTPGINFLTVFDKVDKIALDMPLCSIEVSKGAAPEVVLKAQELAAESLEIAHKRLEVPDPDDLETSVVEGKGEQTNLLVSYTIGPDEYPDFPESSFEPTDEQVSVAGEEIHATASQGDLEVAQTTIEAWKDTTFILRDLEAPEPTPPDEDLKEVGLSIEEPQLRLIVSPEKQPGQTALPREAEPTTEPKQNLKFIEGIGNKLSEVLGLPEDSPIPIHVQPALFADTDFAVEFDCQPVSGYQISEEARIYMAQLIERELNQNPSTRDGSAEVWVRQGQPARRHFVGE